jgi:hypothetical protein
MRKSKPSIPAAVSAVARETLDFAVPNYDEVKQTDAWEPLIEALVADFPDHVRKNILTTDELVGLQEEIEGFLSEDQRHRFWLYNEAMDNESELHQDALYRIAIEMGRQLSPQAGQCGGVRAMRERVDDGEVAS